MLGVYLDLDKSAITTILGAFIGYLFGRGSNGPRSTGDPGVTPSTSPNSTNLPPEFTNGGQPKESGGQSGAEAIAKTAPEEEVLAKTAPEKTGDKGKSSLDADASTKEVSAEDNQLAMRRTGNPVYSSRVLDVLHE
jgi:hypothetical protein